MVATFMICVSPEHCSVKHPPLLPLATAIASAAALSPCPMAALPRFRHGGKCAVFEWRSDDTAVLAAGRAKLLERKLAAVGHKTAVLWESQEDLPDGVRLEWRQPVTYAAGYGWFARTLGDLVRSVLVGGELGCRPPLPSGR